MPTCNIVRISCHVSAAFISELTDTFKIIVELLHLGLYSAYRELKVLKLNLGLKQSASTRLL